MITYGLVGKSLSHSFSRQYFEGKFASMDLADHRYVNIEIPEINQLPVAIKSIEGLSGFNVTIPYKESVVDFMDELHGDASEIRAVNCVAIRDGKLHGYNTDVYGFSQSIKPFLDNYHENALILGTGGASRAVAHALKKIGVTCFFATSGTPASDNVMRYEDINAMVIQRCGLIVNCTPLGMYPDVDVFPKLPYDAMTSRHLAYDLIYNPVKTKFLANSQAYGATIVNGMSMLHLQAEKSWEIWHQS